MLIQADNGELIEFSTQFNNEKENPMTNEMPLIQQPLVAPAISEQNLMAATLPPTANQPAPEAKMPERKQHVVDKLGDGRTFVLRRPIGRDMQNAIRITKEPTEQSMVMAASVLKVDGVALNYEGFLDLDFADITKILTAFNELVGN